jgi:hypothetical protein
VFPWRLGQTAKKKHRSLGGLAKQPKKSTFPWLLTKPAKKNTFYLVAHKNSQEIIFFGCSLSPPRKHY